MHVTGQAIYKGIKTGKKKDGSDWFMAKFLDNSADTFFNCFISEELYHFIEPIARDTTVAIDMNFVPGSKYFETTNIEEV